jgi:23S rRNA (uracil1939-C5)-methyltransferase
MHENQFDLTIDSLADGGWGVGRNEGKVVFVPLTAPGDVIRCAIERDRGSFAFGTLIDLVSPSPARVAPECPVFGSCGGCQWQHVRYESQLLAKHDILVDALVRIGRLQDVEVGRTVGSPRTHGWRTAMDLAFTVRGGAVSVGFHSRHGSDIVPIPACPVAADPINARLPRLPEAIRAAGIEGNGEIRLVAGINGRVAAHLSSERSFSVGERRAERFIRDVDVTGLEVTTRSGASVFGAPAVMYPGWDGANEAGLLCRASSFVQANPDTNRELIGRLLGAGVAGADVLELYCGIGNLTVPMAAARARVTGVEVSRTSVQDARNTVESMGIAGAAFIVGRAEDVVCRPSIRRATFDVLVLDPPRTGARPVVERLEGLSVREIVYISCSPPTLARDLALLGEDGWRPVSIVPLDMFPQTFHTEAICRLRKD